ncbi:MAG TPA: hypothetical protein VKX40_11205 [Aequorivita sp.]|nr:hypothetical protein [Aequorivita sp.]
MKYILQILLVAVIIGLGVGFYIKSTDEATGHLIIGLSIVVGFFILMPLFIYHRWKDRDVKEYMLNKENIMKMHNHEKDKRR